MLRLSKLLSTKPFLIGMIHLRALPGSPLFDQKTWPFQKICENAIEEAHLLTKLGIDGLLIENMHDVPYMVGKRVGAETIAHMSTVSTLIRKELPTMPIGVQILAGANRQALAVAAAAELDFVRVEGFVFSHIADEGFIDSCAGDLLRYRKAIGAENIAVFADIKKKHSSHAITADLSHADVAEAARFCKADGVIVTGSATGHAPASSLIDQIVDSTPANEHFPVLVGSGATVDNVDQFFRSGASGLIVGSAFKVDGLWWNRLDNSRIEAMADRVGKIRGSR